MFQQTDLFSCATFKLAHELNPFALLFPSFPVCFYGFSKLFRCFPHPLPSYLNCGLGRIMDNYPIYKNSWSRKVRCCQVTLKAITACFNTLLIGGDLTWGPLAMCMRLIWFKLPYPAAAQSRPGCHRLVASVSSSVCDGRGLVSTEDRGTKKILCIQICFCFSIPRHEASRESLRLWRPLRERKMRLNKRIWGGLFIAILAGNSADEGEHSENKAFVE